MKCSDVDLDLCIELESNSLSYGLNVVAFCGLKLSIHGDFSK
jgi:hypothetical protein